MKIRRRTAVWICVAAVVLAAVGSGYVMLRPENLRGLVQAAVQRLLVDGYEVKVDRASMDLRNLLVVAEGVHIRRAGATEDLIRVPRAVAETRLWELITRRRVTDVRFEDPEVNVERAADGRIPLIEAFRPSKGPGEARPGVTVRGGFVRFRDPAVLAPGEEIRLAIEEVALLESREGGPSTITGSFAEKGSSVAGREGSAALGRVTLDGEVPPGKRGLRFVVERMAWNAALLERLSPAVRQQLSLFTMSGPFGEGPEAPAIEVSMTEDPGGGAPLFTILARPRGVDFLLKDFPVPFTGVNGDVAWDKGALRIDRLDLRYRDGEFHVKGGVDRLAPDTPGELRFWARGLPLDRPLHDALPPEVRRVWDAYGLSGLLDVTAAAEGSPGSFDGSILRETQGGPFRIRVPARVTQGEMTYHGYEHEGVRLGFAYPLRGVSGRVDVRSPIDEEGGTEILLSDLRGAHGPVTVTAHGTVREWPEHKASVDITIDADDLPLDEDIRRASAGMEDLFLKWAPRGVAKHLQVHVDQDRERDVSAHENVKIEFAGEAGFTYAELPLPLEKVRGTVLYRNERVGETRIPSTILQGLHAEAGGGTLAADGSLEGAGDARVHVEVDAQGIDLDGALDEALRRVPIRAAVSVWDSLHPRGKADLRVKVTGTERHRREEYRVELRGGSIEGWGDLRFPVTGLSGFVEVTPERVAVRDVRGTSSEGEEVALDGSVADPGGAPDLDLRIVAPGSLLDDSMGERLGAARGKMAGYFEFVRPAPGLTGDVTVLLRGHPESLDPVITVEGMRGGVRPMGIENLDLGGGRAHYEAGRVTVEDLMGSMADRELLVRTASLDLDRGEGGLSVEVRRLRFPRDLVPVIPEETAKAIEDVAPGRYFHVDDLRVTLAEGWKRIALDGILSLSPQREGATGGLGLEGTFRLQGVTFLRGPTDDDPVSFSGVVEIDHGVLKPGVPIEGLHGTLTLGGSVGTGGTGVTARLADASATVFGRELRDAAADLSLREGIFLLKDLAGTYARGALHASVECGRGKRAYEGRVELSNAAARALFAPTNPESPMRGQVNAHLAFRNKTGATGDLKGEGRMDVSNAHLMEVPVFQGLYRLLHGDKQDFTAGHIQFDLKGEVIDFDEIELDSDWVAIHKAVGRSRAWIDGRLDMDLRPEVKGLTQAWWPFSTIVDILNVPLRPIYERIHTIHVGGTLENPVVESKYFPTLFPTGASDRGSLPLPPPAKTLEGRPSWDF